MHQWLGNAQRNVQQRAVFAAADCFVVVDALAAPDALQDARLFIEPTGRYEHGDRLADRFRRCVTKEPHGPVIPTGDDAVEVFADDGIVGRRGDGRDWARACSACLRSVMSTSMLMPTIGRRYRAGVGWGVNHRRVPSGVRQWLTRGRDPR